jgi:hypothetical protein
MGIAALVVAVIAGGLLLFLPRAAPARNPTQPESPAAPPTLAEAWPDAKVASYSDQLPDGAQLSPRLHVNADTVVGTAPNPSDNSVRLVIRTATSVTEVHRLSKDIYPEFAGFTVSGDTLVWAETTYPPNVEPQTQIWRTQWREGAPATLITSDTGKAVFFQTQYDIVIADATVYWAAAEFTNVAATQVRSVPLAGGPVTIRRELGTYALSSWPWLVTPYGGRSDPARLLNLTTGQQIMVPHTPGELTRCSPAWCRIGIVGSNVLVRIDVARPDGTARRRIAGGETSPILNDVALLDRFEVLIADSDPAQAAAGQRLDLYDIDTGKTVTVASRVTTAMAYGGLLWWSTGDPAALTWQVLDLHALTP